MAITAIKLKVLCKLHDIEGYTGLRKPALLAIVQAHYDQCLTNALAILGDKK